jgi:hypothetical protein
MQLSLLPSALQPFVGIGFLNQVIPSLPIRRQFQFFTFLIHFPWEMQWSSLEYPPSYVYLIFHGPTLQTGGPGYSFAALFAEKFQAVVFILSRLLHQRRIVQEVPL